MSLWMTTAVTAAGSNVARPSRDLGVPESVERELRLPLELAVTGEREPVGRLSLAKRPRSELAVLEHLGVAQHDLGAGRARHPHPQPADEVLPEVEDRLAGRRRDHLDDRKLLEPADERRHAGLGNHDRLEHGDRAPARLVVSGVGESAPAAVDQHSACVVVLAAVEAAHGDGPGRAAPCGIRHHPLGRSVGVLDEQLRGEPRLVAVDQAGVLAEAETLGAPRSGQPHADRVAAGA